MEYTFDEAIEKNQEELKWKEEENKKCKISYIVNISF